jgi:hypothetical protein
MAKRKTLKDYTALGSLTAELILKNFPFVLFLSFLAMVYIANALYAEKKVREIQKTQAELRQLRWKYMSLKSESMYETKRSEVVKALKDEGLRGSRKSPNKIIVKRAQ